VASPLQNVGASVRDRLLNQAKAANQPFDILLTRYVLERLLYRLSLTAHVDRFVLKGAMLLTTWLPHANRGTRDLDLMAFGESGEDRILGIFREVLQVAADDGVVFDHAALRIEQIRENLKYGGVRLRTIATLAGARVAVVIDIGFGDAVEPGLEQIDYPALLDFPSPKLLAYARETVVAEKVQAMVSLGQANTRLKDYYDVWVLAKSHAFDRGRLSAALTATFARRDTALPKAAAEFLIEDFGRDDRKQRQWAAFVADLPDAPRDLLQVVLELRAFLEPHLATAKKP
jgi:predicted nucleotidyltransferase component of viral defense system